MLSRRIGSRLGTSSIVCRRRQRGAGGESGQLAIGLALTKAAARARSASRACPLHEVAFRFIVPNDFAANCPGDNCPPSTSTDVTGEVYRFVKSNPSTAKDFRTYADDGKKTADACQACALSVLTRAEDVPTACAAIPWFKKQKLARAVLKPEHGRIAQTGSHRWHYSLWVRAKQAEKLHELFEMVAA